MFHEIIDPNKIFTLCDSYDDMHVCGCFDISIENASIEHLIFLNLLSNVKKSLNDMKGMNLLYIQLTDDYLNIFYGKVRKDIINFLIKRECDIF